MRTLIALLLYLVWVFVGAALAAPWVYQGLQLAGHSASTGFLHSLSQAPFHRVVNRCLLGLALVGLPWLLRRLGARSWKSVGFTSPFGQGRHFGFGIALGFISLAVVAVLAAVAGARTFQSSLSTQRILTLILSAAGTAGLVALMEELLFRGVLYGRLRAGVGDAIALVLSSSIYSLVHFFQRPDPPASVHWLSGFECLGQMLVGFTVLKELIPAFFTLALVGLILARLFRDTGSLWGSIGLHAGWIFWLKLYGGITRPMPQAQTWIWGSARLIDGWSAFVIVCACAVLASRWTKRRP